MLRSFKEELNPSIANTILIMTFSAVAGSELKAVSAETDARRLKCIKGCIIAAIIMSGFAEEERDKVARK